MRGFTRRVGKERIGPLGGAFMLDPSTGVRGEEIGLNFFEYYALGRGGAMGDGRCETAIAAFGYFNPTLVNGVWASGSAKITPSKAAEHYTETCRIWGRERFGDLDGLDTFIDQAERVVNAADAAGLPLFAGWRSMPLPDDAPGRAYQLVHVLRELRGGANVIATKAVGLRPLEAVMAVSGEGMARMFGWSEPFPDPSASVERAAQAEDITDDIVAPAFAALGEHEREPFASTLDAMAKAAGQT